MMWLAESLPCYTQHTRFRCEENSEQISAHAQCASVERNNQFNTKKKKVILIIFIFCMLLVIFNYEEFNCNISCKHKNTKELEV